MKAAILQISDIHFGETKNDPVQMRVKEIASCAYSSLTDADAFFLVISGDVAFSGKAEQYEKAVKFVEELSAEIRREKAIPVEVVVVPGNHDCDFDLDSGARRGSIKLIEQEGVEAVDDSLIDSCVSIQRAFFDFRRRVESSGWAGDSLCWSRVFQIGDRTVRFDCLNISWVSRLKESPGSLQFPHQRYHESPRLLRRPFRLSHAAMA